jgi:hypothetical protein
VVLSSEKKTNKLFAVSTTRTNSIRYAHTHKNSIGVIDRKKKERLICIWFCPFKSFSRDFTWNPSKWPRKPFSLDIKNSCVPKRNQSRSSSFFITVQMHRRSKRKIINSHRESDTHTRWKDTDILEETKKGKFILTSKTSFRLIYHSLEISLYSLSAFSYTSRKPFCCWWCCFCCVQSVPSSPHSILLCVAQQKKDSKESCFSHRAFNLCFKACVVTLFVCVCVFFRLELVLRSTWDIHLQRTIDVNWLWDILSISFVLRAMINELCWDGDCYPLPVKPPRPLCVYNFFSLTISLLCFVCFYFIEEKMLISDRGLIWFNNSLYLQGFFVFVF